MERPIGRVAVSPTWGTSRWADVLAQAGGIQPLIEATRRGSPAGFGEPGTAVHEKAGAGRSSPRLSPTPARYAAMPATAVGGTDTPETLAVSCPEGDYRRASAARYVVTRADGSLEMRPLPVACPVENNDTVLGAGRTTAVRSRRPPRSTVHRPDLAPPPVDCPAPEARINPPRTPSTASRRTSSLADPASACAPLTGFTSALNTQRHQPLVAEQWRPPPAAPARSPACPPDRPPHRPRRLHRGLCAASRTG